MKKTTTKKHNNYNNSWIPWVSLGLSFIAVVISIWRMTLANAYNYVKELEFSYDKLGTIIGILLSAVALVTSLYFIILGFRADRIRQGIEAVAQETDDATNAIRENVAQETERIINNAKINTANETKKIIDNARSIANSEAERIIDNANKIVEEALSNIKSGAKDNRTMVVISIYELYSEVIAMTQSFFNSIRIFEEEDAVRGRNDISERIKKLKLDQCRFACDPQNLDIEDDVRVKEIIMKGIILIPDLNSNENDVKMLVEIMNKSNDPDIKGAAKFAIEQSKEKLHPDS